MACLDRDGMALPASWPALTNKEKDVAKVRGTGYHSSRCTISDEAPYMTSSGRVTLNTKWRSSGVLGMADGDLADVGVEKVCDRGGGSRAKLVEVAAPKS